jgi:hypothetical protein
MKVSIFKYALDFVFGEPMILTAVPRGAVLLTVDFQEGEGWVAWFRLPPPRYSQSLNSPSAADAGQTGKFEIHKARTSEYSEIGDDTEYIVTRQVGPFVWHFFGKWGTK